MKKSSIKINAVLNVLKRGMGVVFPLITITYVSRVLGSSNLGTYSFAESIINYFNLFAALGVATYAVREGARIREDREALNRFSSEVFTLNVISTIVSYLVLLLAVLCIPRLRTDALIIAILSINIGSNTLCREWVNSIFEDFFSLTVRYVIFETLSIILLFLLVRDDGDLAKYAWVMVVAISGAYLSNIVYSHRRYVPFGLARPSAVKKHLKPVLYLFVINLTLTIYINSDITILGFMRDSSEVGIYTLASKAYVIIKEVINAITIVAIPRLAHYLGTNQKDAYESLLVKVREALIIMILPCIVGIFCLARQIMILIGGAEYESGWFPLTILCFALSFAVLACFYAQGVLVPNRHENRFLIASTVSAVANIVLNLILIPFFGMAAAAATTVLAEFLVMSICLYFAVKETGYRFMKPRTVLVPVIGCVAVAAICQITKTAVTGTIPVLLVSISVSVVCYFAVLLLFRNSLAWGIVNVVLKKVRR